MKILRLTLPLAFFTAFLGSGCDVESVEGADARGTWQPVGKADGASCEGACGGMAAAGCWCDAQCADYGDCCPDIETACEMECPNLTSPPPDFCQEGPVQPVIDETGCVVAFECGECPNLTSPPPDFCPNGLIEAVIDPATNCVQSFACTECPTVETPTVEDVSACDSRVIEAVVEEGCVVAYECYVPEC